MTTDPTPVSSEPAVFTPAEISRLFIALAQMRAFVYDAAVRGQFTDDTVRVLTKAISVCTIQPVDAHRNRFTVVDWALSTEGLDLSTLDTPGSADGGRCDGDGPVSR